MSTAKTNEELALLAQQGDRDALLALWGQVKRFAHWRARGYPVDVADDLAQAAFLALLDAVQRFDVERGLFLPLYARRLSSAHKEALYGGRGHRAEHDPLNSATSLDAPAAEDSDTELWELLPGGTDTDATAEEREQRAAVHAALDTLNEAERAVIVCIFFRGMTTEVAARALNITQAEAKKTEAAALRKLRHPSVSISLRTYL